MNYDITIVTSGRDDSHCGDFIHRLNNMISVLAYGVKTYHINLELIIVEWNPLNKSCLLKSLNIHPELSGRVSIITVPLEIHKDIKPTQFDAIKSHEINFFMGIAQNVGIRRAQGKFILTTNADILLNENILSLLGSFHELKTKNFYRIYRYDLNKPLSQITLNNFKEVMIECEQSSILRGETVPSNTIHKKAAGDFILAPHEVFHSVRGFAEIKCDGLKIDGIILDYMSMFANQYVLDSSYKIFHQYHPNRYDNEYCFEGHIRKPPFKSTSMHLVTPNLMMRNSCVLTHWNDNNWGLKDYKLEVNIL